MRIYVPATVDELDAVTVTGDEAVWSLAPRAAHAVTSALSRELPDEDEEGLEFAAALEAADDSLALIAGRVGAPRQRLVVTVDVPDEMVTLTEPRGGETAEDVAPSAVEVTATIPEVRIVCVHVDEPEAATDIADVFAAADEDRDEDLDAALDRVSERDLLWYDWSELKSVPRAK
ncbi:DUF6912 family protein [Oerskovia enterophila]|uniref:Uncharacterized protein n=1 Tax=Oerskovia enterophila TaxID=43678 RepID=A0A163QAQ8_9CELL|nr:hypothetical protein [Oerskovia enterophila]KZM33963.1 hypothetical protein OJAG_34470 [Oerskovia enterophila]